MSSEEEARQAATETPELFCQSMTSHLRHFASTGANRFGVKRVRHEAPAMNGRALVAPRIIMGQILTCFAGIRFIGDANYVVKY
ncbi:hypothetical protein EST62_06665 [Chlorobaculum sp. 24CR]|uniref:hypothetical protein n=1 Tax=Chlorobaculum sp. 24CR TaxID=2508878 RepID=UPI00100BDB2C|nr:hypothetical protein [Chlorobaculum sp. 24CR]RXK87548.1 hypothetical protein EST62_06665 [Chlorobaculum sp. 24CR]